MKMPFSGKKGPKPAGDSEGVRQTAGNLWKKIRGSGAVIVLVLVLLSMGNSCYYRVSEQENAVLTMFGNVIRTDTAGLYFKIPYLQRVHLVDMTTHGTGIGYDVTSDGQNLVNEDEGIMITSDFNLLNIDFYLEYKVNDPVAYIYNSSKPEEILKNMTMAAIRSTIIGYTVDDAMTTAKNQIQADVKERLAASLAEQNIGLQVVNISVQDAEPPTAEITSAFKAVENAKQGKDTALNAAKKYQSEQIPAAEAEADRIRQEAEAKKTARIAEAQGQVARFNAMYEQYTLNPLITKQRIFYETMEDILPDLKVIISDGGTQTMMPLEPFAETTVTAPDTGSAQEGGDQQ